MGSTAHHCLVTVISSTSSPLPPPSSYIPVYTCASKCGPSISLCIQRRDFGIASRPVHPVTRFPPSHWRGKKENGRFHLCPPNSSACLRDTPRTPGSSFLLLLDGERHFRGNTRDNSSISCRPVETKNVSSILILMNFFSIDLKWILSEKERDDEKKSKMLMFPKVYYFWRIYSSD